VVEVCLGRCLVKVGDCMNFGRVKELRIPKRCETICRQCKCEFFQFEEYGGPFT